MLIGVAMRQWLRSPRDPLCLEPVFTSKIAQTTHRHARLLIKHFSNHMLIEPPSSALSFSQVLPLFSCMHRPEQQWLQAAGEVCVLQCQLDGRRRPVGGAQRVYWKEEGLWSSVQTLQACAFCTLDQTLSQGESIYLTLHAWRLHLKLLNDLIWMNIHKIDFMCQKS